MVIFSSDNGFFWGEHGFADKRWAYDESIRDPLLIRYPKLIKSGTTREQLALNIDIAPTLLELAGVAVPKAIQGRSLLPLFKDDRAPWRTSFLTEYFLEKPYPRVPTWQAVRTERWKYIHYQDLQDMDELYDLKADSYEMKNVIKGPRGPRHAGEATEGIGTAKTRNGPKDLNCKGTEEVSSEGLRGLPEGGCKIGFLFLCQRLATARFDRQFAGHGNDCAG
jgi:arylsulfatase A-like enzyme